MNRQDLFETVARHLFQQGKRAIGMRVGDEMSGCMYRSPNGTKCAVGCLIPDAEYSPRMEGSMVPFVIENFPTALPDVARRAVGLLQSLQDTHDEECYWESTDVMRGALQSIGKKEGLDVFFLDFLQFNDR